MSVICPQCHTENRAIAKFCIECISTLPTPRVDDGFAPTLQLRWPATTRSPAGSVAAAPFAKGLRVSVAALSVALLIGAAGWLVAGAGGWYLYSAGKAQASPVSEPDRAAPAPAPAPIAHVSPESVAQAVEGPDAPRAPSARPPAAVAPRAACAGMGFIAEARCMAAQCLKPQFRPHPQCDDVRRRQRLEEAKRNPVAP